jgi:hypothetical protein
MDATPIFSFRVEPLLRLDDFEKLVNKYNKKEFFEKLYEFCSQISISLFQISVRWLNEIDRTNGISIIEELRKDYIDCKGLATDCPICKELSSVQAKSINIYGLFDSALNISVLNRLSKIKEVIYENHPSRRKLHSQNKMTSSPFGSTYTEIGKALIDTTIFITYKKFEKYLKDYSSRLKRPETLIGIYNGNKKGSEEFKTYLKDLGLNKTSSDREITALIDAAKNYGILANSLSTQHIFRVIAKEFSITLAEGAKPRRNGKNYELKLKEANKYLKG